MGTALSHDRAEESIEYKVRWFRSLSLEERMEILCSFTDLAITINPKIQEIGRAQQTSERIQVISTT